MTPRKRVCYCLCDLHSQQGVHTHTVDDSAQYIEHNEKKTRMDEIHTGCCWNTFSKFKVAGLFGFCATNRREPGDPGRQPEEECGKYRSSSVRPDRSPSLFGSGLVINTFRFRPGRDRSCPVTTASRSILSSCNFILFNPSRSS